MATPVDHHRVIRASSAIQEQAGNLRSAFSELKQRDYPNEDVALMIDGLVSACVEISAQAGDLGEAAISFKNNAAILDNAFRLLRRYNQIVRLMHAYLEYLGDADVYVLPNALSASLRRRLASIDPDAHVYLHADNQYNYFFVPTGDALHKLLDQAGIAVNVDDKYGIVGFPKSESTSTLSCLLLAHELGHYLFLAQKIELSFFNLANAAGDWQRAEDCLTTQLVDANGQLQMDPVKLKGWWSIVTSWLEEFAADRIAVHLVGPAFALAWLDFTVASTDDNPGQSHPATANRVEEMAAWLENTPWAPNMVNRVQPRTPWIGAVRGAADLRTASQTAPADVGEALRGATAILLPHLAQAVDAIFDSNNLRDQADDFERNADAVLELYRLAIPPGEVLSGPEGKQQLLAPLESTILLCGWLFLLDGLEIEWGGMADGENAAELRQRLTCLLNEHVSKALEICILRRFWSESV
jgi:hypothetical protein